MKINIFHKEQKEENKKKMIHHENPTLKYIKKLIKKNKGTS